jgi:hypothetical protein
MLDRAGKLDVADGDFVEFVATGAPAAGDFRCSACGYGVSVHGALPPCPMCGGTSWEAALFAARPPEPLQ